MTIPNATPPTEGAAWSLDVETFAFLRQAATDGMPVDWAVRGHPQAGDWDSWLHLPPPATGGGSPGDRWRNGYRFGTFYMRWGMDFCTIRDRRVADDSSMITVDDPALLACLRRLDALSSHRCDVCSDLEDHGLAVSGRSQRVLAPVRLRYPPIPFSGV